MSELPAAIRVILDLAFDRHGYPTEESLDAIERYELVSDDSLAELLRAVADAWHYDDRAKETSPGLWVFATGGWSGNESLIDALDRNFVANAFWDRLSTEGGLHIFAVSREAKKSLKSLREHITKWAWSGGKQE